MIKGIWSPAIVLNPAIGQSVGEVVDKPFEGWSEPKEADSVLISSNDRRFKLGMGCFFERHICQWHAGRVRAVTEEQGNISTFGQRDSHVLPQQGGGLDQLLNPQC